MTHTASKIENAVTITAHPFKGLVNGEERFAKAQLARQINTAIKERSLKQQAAELLGVTQPEVSQIANGRLAGFTFDRLYRCLQALDMDIEITVRKHIPVNDAKAGIHVSTFVL